MKALGRRLATPKFIARYAENRSLLRKIIDAGRDLIKYLRADEAGRLEIEETEKLIKMMNEALIKGEVSQNEAKGESGTRYSIVDDVVDDNGNKYKSAVLLDTKFFDGLSPRNWGQRLKNYVEDRANNSPVIFNVVDESGNVQTVTFAKTTDRVKKDGKTDHQVLGELHKTSDNISKLAVIHIDEIADISEENNPYYSQSNGHGWLDKDGWLHRNAYVINAHNGAIYNLTIDIAKAADGRVILYATNGKIKKVGQTKVNSLKIRGSTSHSNFDNSIAQNSKKSTPSAKKSHNLTENTADQAAREAADTADQREKDLRRREQKAAKAERDAEIKRIETRARDYNAYYYKYDDVKALIDTINKEAKLGFSDASDAAFAAYSLLNAFRAEVYKADYRQSFLETTTDYLIEAADAQAGLFAYNNSRIVMMRLIGV